MQFFLNLFYHFSSILGNITHWFIEVSFLDHISKLVVFYNSLIFVCLWLRTPAVSFSEERPIVCRWKLHLLSHHSFISLFEYLVYSLSSWPQLSFECICLFQNPCLISYFQGEWPSTPLYLPHLCLLNFLLFFCTFQFACIRFKVLFSDQLRIRKFLPFCLWFAFISSSSISVAFFFGTNFFFFISPPNSSLILLSSFLNSSFLLLKVSRTRSLSDFL